MLSTWLRALRMRFLLASVISVCLGLVINWWQNRTLNAEFAALTFAGVIALHASVDLLNDYWDYKRQIDTQTRRTKFSGGSGVLPDGLLKPKQVYRAGLILLIGGSLIGAFFIYERGITIALILGFAIVSIYFYSTRIVDSGLGELFVTIKGAMIVLGTYFVQSSQITVEPILAGVVSGVLSSTVLFVNSFPDYDADKAHGRKTLVVVLGKAKAVATVWIFPIASYSTIVISVAIHVFPPVSLITLFTVPVMVKSCLSLKTKFDKVDEFIPVMKDFVSHSRVTGVLLILAFLVDFLIK